MAKKLKALQVRQKLIGGGLRLFSRSEFRRFFRVSDAATTFFLFHHCRDGLFVRLKNGLYALSDPFPLEEEIANRLYQPSYLSFEYVLARHSVIPEAVYSLTSATTKPSRRFEVEGKSYEYFTIKRGVYTGYYPQKINGRLVLMATPEKALIDTLYFVHLKKRSMNERFDLSRLSKKDILGHAKLFHRPRFLKAVKEMI